MSWDFTVPPRVLDLDDRQGFTARSALQFFFYCAAERAVKPCRSSRSNTRGGMIKSHDTCKTGSKHQNPNKQATTSKNTNTNDQRQVSLDGETSGEKKVKRPKLSCVELHEEA